MTISDYVIDEFNQHAFDTANSLGGLDPNPLYPLTTNDQYDAYRHALMSAELTRLLGETLSKKMMDDHENSSPNTPPVNNMDRWNNNVGREEYQKWRAAKDAGQTNDSLEKWIYDRVKEGKTINDPADTRIWHEPRVL